MCAVIGYSAFNFPLVQVNRSFIVVQNWIANSTKNGNVSNEATRRAFKVSPVEIALESNEAILAGKPEPELQYDEKDRKVLICGYERTLIGKQLYPDAQFLFIQKKTPENDFVVMNASKKDLVLFSMTGPCPYKANLKSDFNGNVIYWNGEPLYWGDQWKEFRCNRFYMGVTKKEVLPYRRQTYYAQYAMLMPHIRAQLMERKPLQKLPEKFLVYRSSNCRRYREEAFSDIAKVIEDNLRKDNLGEATGSCSGRRKDLHFRKSSASKKWKSIENMKDQYRFALTMDKVKEVGYVSEKIVLGFAIGAIPIYYGTTEIFKLFNKDAFIYYDVKAPEAALAKILYLEKNASAYLEMRAQPVFAEGAVKNYFSYTDDAQGNGYLVKQMRDILANACSTKDERITKPQQ